MTPRYHLNLHSPVELYIVTAHMTTTTCHESSLHPLIKSQMLRAGINIISWFCKWAINQFYITKQLLLDILPSVRDSHPTWDEYDTATERTPAFVLLNSAWKNLNDLPFRQTRPIVLLHAGKRNKSAQLTSMETYSTLWDTSTHTSLARFPTGFLHMGWQPVIQTFQQCLLSSLFCPRNLFFFFFFFLEVKCWCRISAIFIGRLMKYA